MKKLLTILFAISLTTGITLANTQNETMLERADDFLEELGYPYHEIEYVPTQAEKIQDTKSTLEKLYFELSNINDDKTTCEKEKKALRAPVEKKIEYYEMKLDELLSE